MSPEDEESDAESRSGDDSDASSSGSSKAIMQMAPLDLRFSQRKMRSLFADGKEVADAVELVKAIKRDPEEAEIYGAEYRLEAPFPPIEILRWRCKLRDETTGRPMLDPKTGKEMFEREESWFTLDNRRLYCLQRAAVKLLPAQCTADTVAEIRKDRRMREIRKFRTLDSGSSIMVGSRVDGVPFVRWSWQEELARMRGKGKSKAKGRDGKGEKGGKGHHHNSGKGEDGKARGGKGGKGGKGHGKDEGKGGNSAYPRHGGHKGEEGSGGNHKGADGGGGKGRKGRGPEGGDGKGSKGGPAGGGKGKGAKGGKPAAGKPGC